MSFRDNLQHLRATRNMTQEQLAMLLGVSRQSVTKWEAERAYPEMDKLIKLCSIFECTLDDLVQGDLTKRAPESDAASMPQGTPADVCGYDEHQRMMARKIPVGILLVILGVSAFLFLEESGPAVFGIQGDAPAFIALFAGIIAGLAFFVPAGMEHSAFVKAHPYIEDFYTEGQKADARRKLSRSMVAAIGIILAGAVLVIAGSEAVEAQRGLSAVVSTVHSEGAALSAGLAIIGVGACLGTHAGMMYGRMNVAQYNQNVVDELEAEDIVNARLDEKRKEALLAKSAHSKRVGAVCGIIMIAATIVGLAMMFIPVLSSPNPETWQPEGTSAMYFWLAWPAGGLLCGIAALAMEAFRKDSKAK